MPAMRYSTGSSTVMTLIAGLATVRSAVYSVVDLPEPVGPVTSTMPCGRVIDSRKRCSLTVENRRSPIDIAWPELSRMRMTIFSPHTVGNVATRRSIWRPSWVTEMRPSWGRRRSAMSMADMILSREMTPSWMPRSARCISWSTPSMRNRTVSCRSPGSMWMSLALSLIAWVMSRLTKRMMGASASWSSSDSVNDTMSPLAASPSCSERSLSSSSERR